jgi:hypothetical protein
MEQTRQNGRVLLVLALFWGGFLLGIWFSHRTPTPGTNNPDAAAEMQAEQLSGGR